MEGFFGIEVFALWGVFKGYTEKNRLQLKAHCENLRNKERKSKDEGRLPRVCENVFLLNLKFKVVRKTSFITKFFIFKTKILRQASFNLNSIQKLKPLGKLHLSKYFLINSVLAASEIIIFIVILFK